MKKFRLLSAFVAASTAFSALGTYMPSYAAGTASSKEGKVLNIYSWNEEFKYIFEKYAADICKDAGVEVNWVINPTDMGLYQTELDKALANKNASADEKVDIFLVEPEYCKKYTDSEYVIPVSEVGITDNDMKYQYAYTKELVSKGNKVMGVSWNASPGVFVYRRSIAKKVLGTDDPAKVQKYVKNWNNFDSTAKKMAKKGYYMLSSSTDTYRLFRQNSDTPWVKNGKVKISDELVDWVNQTRKYSKKGYNLMNDQWSYENMIQMSGDGETFGSFWPQWGVDYVLIGFAEEDTDSGNKSYGDFAVCEGPAPYYWGGSWICAASTTDNKTVIGKIMKRLTCNSSVMYKLGIEQGATVNNTAVMKKYAKSDEMRSELLGGQNPYAIYHKNALKISAKNVTKYDEVLNDYFKEYMTDYAKGDYTFKDALNNFYSAVDEYYKRLK